MVLTPETLQPSFSSDAQAGNDRVAVLLMGYGEVESYEDFANYNEQALNLLTAKFAPVPTWVYPPLAKLLAAFDLHEWDHQHDHFISPHNAIFEKQRAGVEQALKERWGDRIKVFKAYNFCKPFLPEQVLAQIKEEGFDKLLIYPLLVVDSIFTSGIAVEQVNKALSDLAGGTEHWLKGTRYIPSFFDKASYIDLLARLVEEKIQKELAVAHLPSQTGIVLMNHGCPHKAKGFTSGIDESQKLYELVRERLIYRYPLISVGWLNHDTPLIDWTQPNTHLAARNLIDLGATSLVFMPIGFATENHETLLDVEHIIGSLRRKHPEVTYVQMDCVNDHPEFLKMVAGWADTHIADLLSAQAQVVNPAMAALQAQSYQGHSHDHDHPHDHDHHAGHGHHHPSEHEHHHAH
ncbi:ferrochelatase [Pseudanabaena sp. FACHB-2040]|uniref:ferrochelatase n=1 Tax=Pseudanabaena sp. FACHB-2040 TaxID=2692859 RepID=UPI001687BC83|nr:ferrochelatase [Pseudanabaena sp. FACHB-2040]MBD2256084.1 ferrochelatase [Pseudanabaena sp. FACHB-2040]